MEFLIENPLYVFLFIFTVFIVFFIARSLSLVIRNGLYISANCWFCDRNSKVLLANRNSFYCSFCEQYNGFDKDGDYNKIIEEQYEYHDNDKKLDGFVENNTWSNGLCRDCNSMQQLKLYQLASFAPLNERNYDAEVEHFEKQLEKAYKLCEHCDIVLQTTIRKQNASIFGNRVKDMKFTKKKSEIQSLHYKVLLIKLLRYFLLICVVLILCMSSERLFLNTYRLKNTISTQIRSSLIHFNQQWSVNNLKYIWFVMNMFGCSLQLFVSVFSNDFINNWMKVNEILSWVVLIVSLNVLDAKFLILVDFLQIFSCLWLIYSYTCSITLKKRQINVKKKKLVFKPILNASKDSKRIDCLDLSNTAIETRLQQQQQKTDSTQPINCNTLGLSNDFNNLRLGLSDTSSVISNPNPFLTKTSDYHTTLFSRNSATPHYINSSSDVSYKATSGFNNLNVFGGSPLFKKIEKNNYNESLRYNFVPLQNKPNMRSVISPSKFTYNGPSSSSNLFLDNSFSSCNSIRSQSPFDTTNPYHNPQGNSSYHTQKSLYHNGNSFNKYFTATSSVFHDNSSNKDLFFGTRPQLLHRVTNTVINSDKELILGPRYVMFGSNNDISNSNWSPSRSSSRSSGFISTNDRDNVSNNVVLNNSSNSLPCSRCHTPEPLEGIVFERSCHLKTD